MINPAMPEESGAPLKSVTIEAQPDGTFMVGTDSEGSEMPEEGMEDMAQDQASGMQPAGSIDEALDMARQMLQDGTEPTEQVSAENAFTQARGGR